MKACAEKHVKDALDLHQKSSLPKVNDMVASALLALQAVEQCPGPNCGIPFEHSGDCNFCEKCTLYHELQVAVQQCSAPVASPITACGAEASSSLQAANSRTMVVQRMTMLLTVKKLQPLSNY
jgi:hypothetical protein